MTGTISYHKGLLAGGGTMGAGPSGIVGLLCLGSPALWRWWCQDTEDEDDDLEAPNNAWPILSFSPGPRIHVLWVYQKC